MNLSTGQIFRFKRPFRYRYTQALIDQVFRRHKHLAIQIQQYFLPWTRRHPSIVPQSNQEIIRDWKAHSRRPHISQDRFPLVALADHCYICIPIASRRSWPRCTCSPSQSCWRHFLRILWRDCTLFRSPWYDWDSLVHIHKLHIPWFLSLRYRGILWLAYMLKPQHRHLPIRTVWGQHVWIH